MVAYLILSRYPEHELRIKEIALKMGFTQVSLSTEVMPMVKIVPRGYTGELYYDSNCYIILSYIFMYLVLL